MEKKLENVKRKELCFQKKEKEKENHLKKQYLIKEGDIIFQNLEVPKNLPRVKEQKEDKQKNYL